MRDNMKLNVRLYNEAFNTRIHKRPKRDKIDMRTGKKYRCTGVW